MRFIVGLLLTALIGFALHYFMPWWWWSGVLVAAILGFALQIHGLLSFLCGFLALGLLWGGMAYWSDTLNESMLSTKIAPLFKMATSTQLLIVTIVLGALLGGLSMLSGKSLRDIVSGPIKKPTKKYRGKYR